MVARIEPKPKKVTNPREVIKSYTSIYGLQTPKNPEFRRLLDAKILDQARASRFISDILLSRVCSRRGCITQKQKESIGLIFKYAPQRIKQRLEQDPNFKHFFMQMAKQLVTKKIYLEDHGQTYFTAFYDHVDTEYDLMKQEGLVTTDPKSINQIPVFELADKVAKGIEKGMTRFQVLDLGRTGVHNLNKLRAELNEECKTKYPEYQRLHKTAIDAVIRKSYKSIDIFFGTYFALKKEAIDKYPEERTNTAIYLVLTKRYKSLSDYYAARKRFISELAEALPDCSNYTHSIFASLLLRNVYPNVDRLVRHYTKLWIELMGYNLVADRNVADEIIYSVLKKDQPSIDDALDRFLELELRNNYPLSQTVKYLSHRWRPLVRRRKSK